MLDLKLIMFIRLLVFLFLSIEKSSVARFSSKNRVWQFHINAATNTMID